MTDHTYITENLTFMTALRNLRAAGKLSYATFSDNWVVRYWRGENVHHIIGYTFDVNSHAAAEIATDKVATYLLLSDAKLPAVEHLLLTTPAKPVPDTMLLDELFERYGKVVIKPTRGGHGDHVVPCHDAGEVVALIQSAAIPSWSASPLFDLKSELRLVVFDGETKLAYRKIHPPVINGLKMFNLGLGATPERLDPAELDPRLTDLAARAMDAIGMRLGAVDIVIDTAGTARVLEINAGFSIEHFAAYSPVNHQAAVKFYETIIETLLASPKPTYDASLEANANYMAASRG